MVKENLIRKIFDDFFYLILWEYFLEFWFLYDEGFLVFHMNFWASCFKLENFLIDFWSNFVILFFLNLALL